MTIFLLGATGRTGKWILANALRAGHTVHILVRDKNKISISSPNLKIFEGNPTDTAMLRAGIQGCDAVISALNISRNSDFPWSKLRTPPTLLSDTMKLVTAIAAELSIRRLIVISAWGVADTREHIPGWFRWFIDHSNIGPAYTDHARQEKIIRASDTDWTIIRPVGLTNSSKEKEVTVSVENAPRPSLTISRKNLAGFVVKELGKNDHIKQAITVSH